MKTGRDLVALATEIQRQAAAKKDFIVPVAQTSIVAQPEGDVRMAFGDQTLAIGDTAHDQIAAALSIPRQYYDRMRAEKPDLLAENVNTWLHDRPNEKRLIRTLDGKARAFLSDKYRPLDNVQLAEAILPVLSSLEAEIISCEITEKRLYIKATDNSISRDIPVGKGIGSGGHNIMTMRRVHPLVVIGNSEIGHGSLSVDDGTFDKYCTNGAVFSRAMRKTHVGQRFADFDDRVYAMLSDQTRAINDAALWATVRDVVKASFEAAKFNALIDKIVDTQSQPLTGDVPRIVEVTAKQFGFNDGERKSVLDHLIKGGDLSRFGLFNAVTRTAEDLTDYDRASEFERIGGKIIELPANDWRQIAEAA